MDKDEQIKELAAALSNHYKTMLFDFSSLDDYFLYLAEVIMNQVCKLIYDERKAAESDILEEVGNVYICLDEDNEEMYARDFGWFKTLCDKYGVDYKSSSKESN